MRNFALHTISAGYPAVILAVLILFCAATHAADITLDYDIFIFQNRLATDFNYSVLFNPELVAGIKKGFPLHIDFIVELKKSLPFWFDQALSRHRAFINIEYQSFGARFRMDILDFEGMLHQQVFKEISNMTSSLNEILVLECDSIGEYNADDNLYFDFLIRIRRLTADEISHAGDWYRGKTPGEKDTSPPTPGKHENIFDQVLNMTGLGPAKYHYSSYIFKPSALKEVRP